MHNQNSMIPPWHDDTTGAAPQQQGICQVTATEADTHDKHAWLLRIAMLKDDLCMAQQAPRICLHQPSCLHHMHMGLCTGAFSKYAL